MQQAVKLAQRMSKQLDKNWLPELEENNLHKCFEPIYKMNLSIINSNTLVAYCIYAHDPDSTRLDIRKDRYDNKLTILESINEDTNIDVFHDIIANENETFNNVVLNYLEFLTDWRWQTIYSLLDYYSNMIRFSNQKTENEKKFDKINKEGEVKELTQEYDIDVIAKVNKQKGELLELAIKSRERAEKLLLEIKKDFVTTDTAVQSDLGFVFTDTAKEKVDIYSWRAFIRNLKKKQSFH